MSVDLSTVQLLLGAKLLGAEFTRSLTLGRQAFYPDEHSLSLALRMAGVEADAHCLLQSAKGWSEGFFELLGAQTVDSLDQSPFEGANIVQDLNKEIPDSLRQRFTLVFDGGTLEHVFDFPAALRNCLEMISIGGWFVQMTPANNFMGHGFYQFSPEYAYRALAADSGFEVVAVLLVEAVRGGRWYTVADPVRVGHRVQITNRLPMLMCTLAKRTHVAPVLAKLPLQATYQSVQQTAGRVAQTPRRPSGRQRAAELATRYLPPTTERWLRSVLVRSIAQPDCIRRVTAEDVTLGRYVDSAGGRCGARSSSSLMSLISLIPQISLCS